PFPRTVTGPPGAKALLRLRIDALGAQPLAGLELDSLRLFLVGDAPLTTTLYELIFNNVSQVVMRDPAGPPGGPLVRLEPARVLRPVGLDPDDALLPYPATAFPGYRLLTEFFAYPNRFLFVDLGGWAEARAAGVLNGRQVEINLFLERTDRIVTP